MNRTRPGLRPVHRLFEHALLTALVLSAAVLAGCDTTSTNANANSNSSNTNSSTVSPTSTDVVPTIGTVAPAAGPQSGGTNLVVSGSGFVPGSNVLVGTLFAANVVVDTAGDSLSCVTPASFTTGPVDVTVFTTSGASATAPQAFTYNPQLSVMDLTPTTGPISGGTLVTVRGLGFGGNLQVRFGTAIASGVTVAPDGNSMTVRTPAVTGPAVVDVTVSSDSNGISTAPAAFAYLSGAAPAVTGVTVPGGMVLLSGSVTYEKVRLPLDASGQPLPAVHAATPVRFADLIVVDPVSHQPLTITSSATDASGQFTMLVPRGQSFSLGVLASTQNTSTSARLQVLDPSTGLPYRAELIDPRSGAPFLVTSSPAAPLAFATIPVSPTSACLAGAFNIFDAGVTGTRSLQAAGFAPPPVSFAWSPASTAPSGYSRAAAQITIRGGDPDTDDTDEFDDAVILRELGHHALASFSRDSSLGGARAPGALVYPALAYSEGVCDALAGIFLGSPFLVDAAAITGPAPTASVVNLTGGRGAAAPRGIGSELSVAELLWHVVSGGEGRPNLDGQGLGVGFAPFLGALAALRSSQAYVSIDNLLFALVATGAVDQASLQQLTLSPEDQQIAFPAADAWPPVLSAGASVVATAVTCAGSATGPGTGLAATNQLYRVVVPNTRTVRLQLALGGSNAGSPAAGTGVELVLLTPDNQLAVNASGNAVTPPPGPTGPITAVSATLAPGTYLLYVDGRPPFGASALTNLSAQSVPCTLSVSMP